MNIVEKLAQKSYQENIKFSGTNVRDSVKNVKYQLYDFEDELDRVKFLNVHLELANKEYQDHLKTCTNLESCPQNEESETIIFYFQQELKNLGIKINDDTFTYEEKVIKENQLDEILRQFEEVKLGNQIIYDDILKEIQELKELYFLGKKKWHQLLAGKIVEMTAGGIISETISKDILSSIKPTLNNLLK